MKKLFLLFVMVLATAAISAQVTTSSINGKVTEETGAPLIGATVIAVHTPSGTQFAAVTNSEGRFSINGMRAGGPYKVDISYLGYQTVSTTDIILELGEPFSINQSLKENTETLERIVVVTSAASKFSNEKKGASTNISQLQIANLPTISRSITDVTKLSPYGGNGMSFSGTDGRTANFTVDGANFNNNFGLSSSLPGGGSPISIDAIEEMQVVISPFDVRQSNFIGGGVNAITKSGTNRLKGSAYIYHNNENMRGNAVDGLEISGARDKDRTTTYGFTLGGPIVKSKLFFFANFEMTKSPVVVNRWRASEDGVADADNYISRTTIADMQKVKDFMMEKYGYDTGSFTDFPADESNRKFLVRLDWNINRNNRLALRYNYTLNQGWNSPNGSSSDAKSRTTQNRMSQYSMSFANSMYSMDNKVNTWSLDLNSRLSDNISNQLLATYSMLDDVRGTNSQKFPFIDIMGGDVDGYNSITPYMSLGYELFTWNNGVHNRVITVKDDVSYLMGDHKLTAGLSYEYQMADNAYMRNGTIYYRYKSLNDFMNSATPETISLTYGYDGEENPAARVRFHKGAAYVQDDWSVNDKLKITAGIRLETIVFDNQDLMTNNAIKDIDYNSYSIDTGKWPTAKLQFNPRIGFTYDVLGDRSLKIRGGTGLFTGRLPLVFFTNMPTNAGMVQYNLKYLSSEQTGGSKGNDEILSQFSGTMITDVQEMIKKLNGIDSERFPTSITPDKGVLPSSIACVDPSFKMPQVWKTSLAIDYKIPTSFPFSVTGEFIFNKTINGVCMTDLNLKSTEGFPRLNGADNRHTYPSDYAYTKTSAFMLTNTNKGYGYTASLSFNAEPVEGLYINGAYTRTLSKELTGMPGSDASSAFTYIPTSEGPNNPILHNSSYVTPDRAYVSLSYRDKCNNKFSLFYETWRGGYNYTYMYADDLNGDAYNYDVMYIPANRDEIRFATQDDEDRYWAFADKDKYLKANKGKYAEAYSVYSPWVHRIDLRFAHDFVVNVGNCKNVLELSIDIKNVANLFNSSWGVSKYMNPELNSGRILGVKRIDPDGAPVYTTIEAVNGNTQTWQYNHAIGQCWYAQIGLKYTFN